MLYVRRFACLILLTAAAFGQATYSGVHRIVAVGDIHGDYEAFVSILRLAGVIDKSNKWIGGDTHLVQTGDAVDRGPDSRKVLELLIDLGKQARRSKGMVHALLGNHEAMNIYGDLRYVSPADFASYRTGRSQDVRDQAYETMPASAQKEDEQYRKKWDDEHPLGWIEQREAFSPKGEFGKVLLEEDAVVKVNDVLFLHGGISEKYVSMSLADLNSKIRAELRDFNLLQGGLSTDQQGPLWYRGLAQDPEPKVAELVASILKSFGVSHIVIGHTPTLGAVTPRFEGKVIMIDVGLSKSYYESPACLIIEDGKFFAMHRGTKVPIPEGVDAAAYLKQVAEIDPPGTLLRRSVLR
jgi:Calcineurin-like phosphoesterase